MSAQYGKERCIGEGQRTKTSIAINNTVIVVAIIVTGSSFSRDDIQSLVGKHDDVLTVKASGRVQVGGRVDGTCDVHCSSGQGSVGRRIWVRGRGWGWIMIRAEGSNGRVRPVGFRYFHQVFDVSGQQLFFPPRDSGRQEGQVQERGGGEYLLVRVKSWVWNRAG